MFSLFRIPKPDHVPIRKWASHRDGPAPCLHRSTGQVLTGSKNVINAQVNIGSFIWRSSKSSIDNALWTEFAKERNLGSVLVTIYLCSID
jgi:hypothetical protein